jgi:hypothetical protein
MAVYTSVPILEALISDVARDPFCNGSLIAMVSSILSYYFPATQDFAVCYKEAQGNFSSHFLVRRLRSSQSGRRVLVNHLIVVFSGMFVGPSKLGTDLKNILAHTELEGPQCWAMAFYGPAIQIFMYDTNQPGEEWLLPWKLPGQVNDYFGLRDDGEAVDLRLRKMKAAADEVSGY